MTSSTSCSRIARILSKIDILWCFHQNARRTFLFPTRYDMMGFQNSKNLDFSDGRRAAGWKFFPLKSTQQYFRNSQEGWIPVYDFFKSCWQKYSAAGHFDPPPTFPGCSRVKILRLLRLPECAKISMRERVTFSAFAKILTSGFFLPFISNKNTCFDQTKQA